MKIKNCKILIAVAFVGLTVISGGCAPSVQDVAKVVSSVPLGASRDEVRKVLVEAYGEKYPKWKQSYGLTDPPRPVTKELIKARKELIAVFNQHQNYIYSYPPDLFDKMPPKAFFDMVGIVADASEGDGSFSIYYDSNTNYIGFFASSTAKAQ